ncbi:MmgE/PrpD family protein [Roseomonas alkaliterrae]|uniref:2-methylcitrate dehydratase PrpD n=1 Tax=Neoroseomonas alkaliterrae TaxID=1452450 RepID=A0A840YC15_9PROT|nr:MmgE/PrpD family protein [Neoroseomonas alkaliterrae]MBB5691424.1 2-methylcitrate dehydratase PrpD [Neoroseomonas alkaliterrae]MBR0675560.1 MmgE/PrpD family protein [Neoroseomonas alkaliterrae]
MTTRALAEFVAALRHEDLPPEVMAQAARVALDAIGCAVAAWTEDREKARIARDIAAMYPAQPGAGVIGAAGLAAQPAFAALANGILVNAADNDDTHKRALLHVGSVVLPASLALAQARGLGGRPMLAAIVAGYEVAVRVGMAVMPTHYRFWHSTATNGTFGGAASAAHAMGLDADGVQRALGLAGTQAAGLNTFFESGDMTKSLHPGKAALNGVLSAQLAALGMTAPPGILEHPKGYLAAFSLEPRASALTEGLGTRWEILQNGFKFFPSILASHSPIQATLAIVARHRPDPARIARITNETYDTVKSHFSAKEAATPMAARVSVPYCIAAAAVDGALTQAQFAPGRIHDPLIRRVLDRTEVIADPALNALYPAKFPARVTITMEDGQSFTETVMLPKGDPGAPLSDAELEDKFRGNCEPLLGGAQAARLRDAILRLPDGGSVEAVSALLAPGAP